MHVLFVGCLEGEPPRSRRVSRPSTDDAAAAAVTYMPAAWISASVMRTPGSHCLILLLIPLFFLAYARLSSGRLKFSHFKAPLVV